MTIRIGNQIIAGTPALESFVTTNTEQTISGNKTFTGTVAVPIPLNNNNAANKLYVDNNFANNNLSNLSLSGEAKIKSNVQLVNALPEYYAKNYIILYLS